MKKEKQFLNEIAMKMGKVYTAKDNPPFKVTELNKLVPNPDGTNTLVPTQQSKLVPTQQSKLVPTQQSKVVPKQTSVLVPNPNIDNEPPETRGTDVNDKKTKRSPLSLLKPDGTFDVDKAAQYGLAGYVIHKLRQKRKEKNNESVELNEKKNKKDSIIPATVKRQLIGALIGGGLGAGAGALVGGKLPYAGMDIPSWMIGGTLGAGIGSKIGRVSGMKKDASDVAGAVGKDSVSSFFSNKKQDESNISEGPSYEYRKHTNKIGKSMKQHQGAVLDFYELLRKKGLDKEAAMLLDAYKKNLVTFKKSYDVLMRKLV